MQTLKLNDDLMKWVSEGKKHGTSRKGRRDIALGALTLEATNGTLPPIQVDVASVTYTRLKNTPTEVIQSEGYKNILELVTSLRRFYPDVTLEDEFTLVEWAK